MDASRLCGADHRLPPVWPLPLVGPKHRAPFWDKATLSAIRIDKADPLGAARNLLPLSWRLYDAWAAYDPTAVGYLFHEKHVASDLPGPPARKEAISYAAYRLPERVVRSFGERSTRSRAGFPNGLRSSTPPTTFLRHLDPR